MKRSSVFAIVLGVVCSLLPFAGQFYGDRSGGWLMVDFRAYYCAASAAARHENPYFAASLHECESRPAAPFFHAPQNVTVPAPYPPYVLRAVAPLARLPFGVAAILWWLILVACVLVAAYALARVTRQPLLVGWAALVLSLGLVTLDSGNLIPICIAALLVAALCAQLGHLQTAAIAVAVAMVEPQLALPAAVALFVRFPRTRLVLALLCAIVAVGSLAAAGFARNLQYFTSVLPAHALAEVSRDNQYSLSTVLAALGVPDAQAVALGGVSYVLAGALGIVVGIRLARDYLEPAFVLLVPPAFSLLGGSFVHTGEIAAAVPAALLLLSRAQHQRGVLLVVLPLLAVPWMLATSAALLLAPVFPVAYLVYAFTRRDRTLALASALASLLVILALFFFALQTPPHPIASAVVRPPIDPRLAEAGWRTFVLGNSTNRLVTWLLRLPTWVGLIALAGAAIAMMKHTSLSTKLAGT